METVIFKETDMPSFKVQTVETPHCLTVCSAVRSVLKTVTFSERLAQFKIFIFFIFQL
jgi:hypothetical protein